jgi:hypothetical protein
VNGILRRAEEILEVACQQRDGASTSLILFDRAGGMRMMDPQGWSLSGLIQEYGANEVYRIERKNGSVRVEGWSPLEKCLLQRQIAPAKLTPYYASMLQVMPRLAV